jgi:hypothetical protein
MKGFVYFHQGWTDILGCLALIDYYKVKYEELVVFVRFDAENLVSTYLKGKPKITILSVNTDNGRYYGSLYKSDVNDVTYIPDGHSGQIIIPNDFDLLLHAEHDRFRVDDYRNYWYMGNYKNKPSHHFLESFYTFYDIPFIERVNSFNLYRDTENENLVYLDFIKSHGDNYILFHDDQENHLHGNLHVSTKIDFNNKKEGYNYINLNKKSNRFFDYIKVLENANEIHLVDSVWAGVCYQIDAKYGLFKDKSVYLYPKRGHNYMFENPIKLKNWTLVS